MAYFSSMPTVFSAKKSHSAGNLYSRHFWLAHRNSAQNVHRALRTPIFKSHQVSTECREIAPGKSIQYVEEARIAFLRLALVWSAITLQALVFPSHFLSLLHHWPSFSFSFSVAQQLALNRNFPESNAWSTSDIWHPLGLRRKLSNISKHPTSSE